MARVYKHCVVGHGLTGTAACKYLAAQGEDVLLLGPSEEHGAHGACYDEGRIYRILDPLESWALLAERSVKRYADIAGDADVDFYRESGLLIFGVEDDFLRETRAVATRMKTALTELTPAEIKARFPWLGVPGVTKVGLLQSELAGHMSPRKLTQAQLALARRHGAEYVDAAVAEIKSSPTDDGRFLITTEEGETVVAENVLVAAGCYTSLMPLLPEEVVISLTGAQAMLVELSAETAHALRDMPSMIYEGEAEEDCVYLLPPIQYPDGKWLLKIGPSTAFAPPLNSRAEVDVWFRRGHLDPVFETKALATFAELFPSVDIVSWRPLLCVTDTTPKQNAYIDILASGWGICTGGNGWAAKSSDEIGLLAAQMMFSPQHWGPDPELPREWFRATLPHDLRPTPQLQTCMASVTACGEVLVDRVVESLQVLTQVLAQSPKLRSRPAQLAGKVRDEFAALWAQAGCPTVVCSRHGGALAPSHPFIALRTDSLDVTIVLSG